MPLTKQEGDKRAMDYHYPLQHEIFNYQVCKFGKKPRVRGFELFCQLTFIIKIDFGQELIATIIEKATTTTKMAFLTLAEAQLLIQHNLIIEHGQVKDRGEFECMFCKAFGHKQSFNRRDHLKRHYSNHLNFRY